MHFLFVLVDSRLEPQKIDLEFIEMLGEGGVPFVIIFTKCDKQSAMQSQRAVTQGYSLSFGERIFRSPKTIEALHSTPLPNLFVETDESDTPIAEIYARIAELRGISTDLLIRTTQENQTIGLKCSGNLLSLRIVST